MIDGRARSGRTVIRIGFAVLLSAVPVHGQLRLFPSQDILASGVWFRLPNLANPAAMPMRIGDPEPKMLEMAPVGWDLCGDLVVFPGEEGQALILVNAADETSQAIFPREMIFDIVRPAFSPDCRSVVVQANAMPGAEDLNIYVVNLESRVTQRIGNLTWNEESPRFFPVGNRVAYSSFSATAGAHLHVYDLSRRREVLKITDGGALQIAIAPKGDRILDPRKMKVYSAKTGKVVADLLDSLLAALPATGYTLDKRFLKDPGLPNKGIYPLDAAFSSDGKEIVLDWALRRGSKYGNVLMVFTIATGRLRTLTDLIPTNVQFTNRNNFSQLNPIWKK